MSIFQRFTREARAATLEAITDAGGNEVFLLGSLTGTTIADVRVLARGNRRAVPAILGIPRPGEVVIHNHPGGRLTPSPADLDVATTLGNNGVGSYIVNNEVTEVYVVVEPLIEKESPRIDPDEAVSLLGPDGQISATLEGYEHRPQQLAMAEAVARAFNDDSILTVEAGTGTGKTLAYLVPAILWAKANSKRVIASTHTINLQEQLVHKDLPFLIKSAGLDCRVALVKGRGNYLCRRKVAQLETRGAQLIEDEIARELRALLDWAKHTSEGNLADLSIRPRPAVWEQVASENDNCLRVRCPHYADCFFYAARREAAAADILVVNHHLLMADVALREELGNYTQNAVLPPATRVIIDEAHHLEDVATTHFGGHVSLAVIERNLGRLRSTRTGSKGILPALSKALASIKGAEDVMPAQGAHRWIEERLLPRRRDLWAQSEEVFSKILTAYYLRAVEGTPRETEQKLRITAAIRETEFWQSSASLIAELATAADTYAGEITGVLERAAQLSESASASLLSLVTELRAIQGRIAAFAQSLIVFTDDDEQHCRWMELRRQRGESTISFHMAPIEVAPLLHKALFERFETAVLTSATLAVNRRFEYLHQRIGIDRVDPPERVEGLRVDSPFDFEVQARLLVPTDLCDPGLADYEPGTHELIRNALDITQGGTLVLFTSYGALNRAHAALEKTLLSGGLVPLRQGQLRRHLLLARLKDDPKAVLFATDSFWEGIDIKGNALRCVIIHRLPFKVPTEPIEQARVEAVQQRGGNSFFEHTVPQAVLKLKQGFGRLIRSRQDRGCVLILDSRIVRKRYGKMFLDSLPPARQAIGTSQEVLDALQVFFVH